jgi:hypothetical protein
MVAAAHEIYAVLAIDRPPCDVAVNVVLGQLLPAFDDGILDLRHACLPGDEACYLPQLPCAASACGMSNAVT